LAPLEWLLLDLPPQRATYTTLSESGLPKADQFEWDLLTPLYELANNLIPYLADFWYIWLGLWILLLIAAELGLVDENSFK
jgi:hypothetical protein